MTRHMDVLPQRLSHGIVQETVGDELLVHDAQSGQAHCLPAQVASVWEACDGNRDRQALAQITGHSDAVVADALDALADAGLLALAHAGRSAADGTPTGGAERVGRRQALGRFAAAGLAAPLIFSVAIGTPLAHASGTTCQSCASTNCSVGYMCDAAYQVCVPTNCHFTATCATPGAACSSGTFTGVCSTATCGTQALCCPH